MNVALIVAYDRKRAIGKDNRMPWHLPADLAFFKRTTMGHAIVMGRNTFESIGRPLPGRRNMVVSRTGRVAAAGVEVFSDLDSALHAAGGDGEVFVIGGAQLFLAALPRAGRILATEIHGEFPADVFFPALPPAQWREGARVHQPSDANNPNDMDFVVYERIAKIDA